MERKTKRPIKIKVGMFGKFWDDGIDCVNYGYLTKIKNNYEPYVMGCGCYKHFELIDPATLPKMMEVK